MLDFGKAENAFSSFLGRIGKIPALFQVSKLDYSWTTLYYKLWLKFFEIEIGTVRIRDQTQNKLLFNIQCKCSNHIFSLYRWNFHRHKLINTINNIYEVKM